MSNLCALRSTDMGALLGLAGGVGADSVAPGGRPPLSPMVMCLTLMFTAMAWPRIVDRAVCGWWRVGSKA